MEFEEEYYRRNMKKLSEPVKLWIKALRSGKYKQTKGRLKDVHSFDTTSDTFDITSDKKFIGHCCLGVACEVAIEQGVIKSFVHKNGTLPIKVKDWLGLSTNEGRFEHNGDSKSLTNLNDSGVSFEKIVKIISKSPKGLFKK
jgi:hypothetical protein